MKRTFSLLLSLCLILTAVCSIAFSCAEEGRFSLRGGVQFGMTPEEVIDIEKSNGFYHDVTSSGDTLYVTENSLQLYYGTHAGKLGNLEVRRFEYDFSPSDRRLFQFYYVFDGQNAFDYLSSALSNKYGPADASVKNATAKYLDTGASSHFSHARWAVSYGDELVVIDLWDNLYDVCFLSYQSFNAQTMMEEDESLEFGL